MISSILAYTLLLTMQATDGTRASRMAFNDCMRTYMQHSIEGHMTMAAFNTGFAQQCATEEAAYRNAVLARENANRATRASAEQTAREEVEEARTNFHDRFEMAITPR